MDHLSSAKEVQAQIVEIEGEKYYRIEHVDLMRPFLMSIVSDSNHWLFCASNGGITAGRKNAEYALFPYTTDDKLIDTAEITGSKSMFMVKRANEAQWHLWEPFSHRDLDKYTTTRSLYKSTLGNKLIFEEINHSLEIAFKYSWNSSHEFGFVRKCKLYSLVQNQLDVELLDGIQNILPYGVNSALQTTTSNLVDAYKRSERQANSSLAIYALSAAIVDRAEPSESLKANVVWSYGLPSAQYLLSAKQLDAFRQGKAIKQEEDVIGEKGAYFMHCTLKLNAKQEQSWNLVANVNQDHQQVIRLLHDLQNSAAIHSQIEQDIALGAFKLRKLVGAADGIQHTSDALNDTRHFSNVLFNIMRGGIFDNNYTIEKEDFIAYLKHANKAVAKQHAQALNALPSSFSLIDLEPVIAESTNADFKRLSKEYLPLKFSRRHGDPSRPWNKFSINTLDETTGKKVLDYEGNWRDIFQNWEALVAAYPKFIEGMISKFLNASTFDGYNPYRVTKGGFDWETIEPDNPWSYIGYWGDHQIIYLLKFLEFAQQAEPKLLESMCNTKAFVYANVPYRIKAYEQMLVDPKNTIDFDEHLDEQIREAVAQKGADGALLLNAKAEIHAVSFMEKIMATLLAKVSNYIPEGGIWMNTQRPEWNDANNALVGNGISVVTLNYLKRFVGFFEHFLSNSPHNSFEISAELATLFHQIHAALAQSTASLKGKISDADRFQLVSALEQAASDYRLAIYQNPFSGQFETVSKADVLNFLNVAAQHFAHCIEANKRADGLQHAYNILDLDQANEMAIEHLSEMLEGQVAALSSGYLKATEAVELLDALRNSALYRADQHSYMLYPNKQLPRFLEKNSIPPKKVESSKLLTSLVANNDRSIITKDVAGGYHFNGNFKNASDLKTALQELADTQYAELAKAESAAILHLFEEVFNHKAFTGRSGTFYAYEGLGSIYWHMVSKLYLAVCETCQRAINEGANRETVDRLVTHLYEVGKGIGVHKSPLVYGAIPTDPYSHTPIHRGAQQPGMTGQVKEDILVRFGQLGVRITEGVLQFQPSLIKSEEFLKAPSQVRFINVHGEEESYDLATGSLAFTYCQVPVIYRISEQSQIIVHCRDKSTVQFNGLSLDAAHSQAIFNRTAAIQYLEVHVSKSLILY